VATRSHVLAISPADPQAFLQNIQRAIEMGSLSPAAPQSLRPVFLIGDAWQSRLVRFFWLGGLLLNIGLLAWTGLMIPSLGSVSLGFTPSGDPGEAIPAVGLLLVPIISIFIFALGWAAGLFLHRRSDQHTLALIVWGNSLFTSLLFLAAILFLVTTPG
jgi:hypothetical protein